MNYNKYYKDGKVAVLYSPQFGAGWSSWSSNYQEALTFDSRIVQRVLDKEPITEDWMKSIGYEEYTCLLGADDLAIQWLEPGTDFYIDEYDGFESVVIGYSQYSRA